MSNAIQFLETLGRSPLPLSLSAAGYGEAVAAAGLDEPQCQALLQRDAGRLSTLLDVRAQVFCLVATPDGGETQDESDRSNEDADEPEESDDAAAPTGSPG